jgi:hypothetical protein
VDAAMTRVTTGIALLATVFFMSGAPDMANAASDLPPPTMEPVLVVSGQIDCFNEDGRAVFDLPMLRRMPQTDVTTTTIWTDGPHVFTGVALVDFIRAIAPTGAVLKARAINDYAVDIPVSEAVRGGPIIAYMIDGKAMSVRDKGPLWVVFPYDQNPDYRNEVAYSQSIWQLDRIVVAD